MLFLFLVLLLLLLLLLLLVVLLLLLAPAKSSVINSTSPLTQLESEVKAILKCSESTSSNFPINLQISVNFHLVDIFTFSRTAALL